MKKYTIIGMWISYNYNDNFFINSLNNIHKYVDKNNENIDFLISGPFISDKDYNYILNSNCKNKILYISEPIENSKSYKLCYKLFKKNSFDKIIGCINQELNRIKFPLYIEHIFDKEKNFFKIINENAINSNLENKKFCTLINNHDKWNTRTPIYNKIKELGKIDCPCVLYNNCSVEELNRLGNPKYISNYLFNICSENSLTNVKGYITEKLVNCCNGGAIPIYCGWFDEIDSKIFNKNRILFYNPNDSKSINEVYLKIKCLIEDNKKLNIFYKQNIFMDTAYDTIKNMDYELMEMFKKL
jgi:hypothetical protein